MISQTRDNYVSVNGLNMYYEIHGTGEPLLMLHGEFSTIGMFSKVLPELAKKHQVIAVEQQGHGHTADIDRSLSFAQMADDTAALLEKLGIKKTDVFGYSGGGTVALYLAVRHRKLVRKLALASTGYDTKAYYPGIMEGLQHLTAESLPPILRQEYERVAPNPDGWATLVAKHAAMVAGNEHLEPAQLQSIKADTMVILGDHDIIRSDYAKETAKLLHAELVTIPGDHASYIVEQPNELLAKLTAFLDAPLGHGD